jgi:hypothetical protein
MNAKLIAAAEALADKAVAGTNGYDAAQYAQGALALAQAATALHYAESQPPAPSESEGDPA